MTLLEQIGASLIAAVLLAGGGYWVGASRAHRADDAAGALAERDAWRDKYEKEARDHDHTRTINTAAAARELDLEARLAKLLADGPLPGVLRLQVTAIPAADLREASGSAGVGVSGSADAGPARAGADPGGDFRAAYLELRTGVLELGADAEKLRGRALDAQAGWPH